MGQRGLGFWQRFAVGVIKPVMLGWTRRDWRGRENIPATGGVIVAANHPSEMDPFTLAHFIYESDRWPQYLAKASVFTIPLVGPILRSCKQIPVHRGTADAAKSLLEAAQALRNGELVIIYPEGTTPKDGDFWPMKGKTGVARLWLETGVPVIPVLSWGPQLLFDPRDGKRGLRLRRTPVTLAAGPPIDLSQWSGAEPTAATLQAITTHIMDTLRDMMAQIRAEAAAHRRTACRAATGRAAADAAGGAGR